MVAEFFINYWTYLSHDLFGRVMNIFQAPFEQSNMLWMLIPLLITLLAMEFYFGRYKEEELGWNTAFGNALVLLFISIDLFRHVYEPIGGSIGDVVFSAHPKIIISLVILALALILMIINFFHFLPKKAAYIISSPPYINLVGLLAIIIVYSESVLLDLTTLFACISIFILANIIFTIIYLIVPSYKPPLQRILTAQDVEKFAEENQKKKNVKVRKIEKQ